MSPLPPLLLLVLLFAGAASAYEARFVRVEERGPMFRLDAQLYVRAAPDAVYALLTDYDHWDLLTPSVRESERLQSLTPSRHHVRSVNAMCVFLLCAKVMQVQEVVERRGREVYAYTLPNQSNLRYGRVIWRVEPERDGTRLTVEAEMEPEFWLPPLVGPWAARRVLTEQVLEMAAGLERLASREP